MIHADSRVKGWERGLLVVVSAVWLALPGMAAPAPDAWGPYPVGVTTFEVTDSSRDCAASGGKRTLLVEVWYPAADEAEGLPPNRYSDFFARASHPAFNAAVEQRFGIDPATIDARYENRAVRDARIRDGVYPLVLFSHGNGGIRHQNAFQTEHLASHGYIVTAPDHTGNASATLVNGRVVVMDGSQRAQSAQDRPLDLVFLIDVFTRLNQGADSRFTRRVDLARIGAMGHSFGAYTCARAADLDERIRAIVPMAASGRERTRLDVPTLAMVATEDATIGEAGNAGIRQFYERSTGPAYLVEFVNGGHYTFTEMFQFNPRFGDGVGAGKRITDGSDIEYLAKEAAHPLINGYTTAFFGRFLKEIAEYDAYLAANHAPDELLHGFMNTGTGGAE